MKPSNKKSKPTGKKTDGPPVPAQPIQPATMQAIATCNILMGQLALVKLDMKTGHTSVGLSDHSDGKPNAAPFGTKPNVSKDVSPPKPTMNPVGQKPKPGDKIWWDGINKRATIDPLQQSPSGDCTKCRGAGESETLACDRCDGSGREPMGYVTEGKAPFGFTHQANVFADKLDAPQVTPLPKVVLAEDKNYSIKNLCGNDIPKVVYATIRDAGEEMEELHIECRFDDGQKYAAVWLENDEIGNALAKQIVESFTNAKVNANLLSCCKELVELYEAVERKLVNRFIPVSIIVPEKFSGATFRAKAAIAAAEKKEK